MNKKGGFLRVYDTAEGRWKAWKAWWKVGAPPGAGPGWLGRVDGPARILADGTAHWYGHVQNTHE